MAKAPNKAISGDYQGKIVVYSPQNTLASTLASLMFIEYANADVPFAPV